MRAFSSGLKGIAPLFFDECGLAFNWLEIVIQDSPVFALLLDLDP
jgi:hypothetical protein